MIDRAVRGVRFLLDHRPRHRSGLVALCHPWESGADDSPRWDDACPGGFAIDRWRVHKNQLVSTIERSPAGSPLTNPAFDVASVGFTALVAFNAAELAATIGDAELARDGSALVEALAGRWDPDRVTWGDAGATERGSGQARTLDGLLPCSSSTTGPSSTPASPPSSTRPTTGRRAVLEVCTPTNPATHRAPTGAGPAWPQLSYLLWVAARNADRPAIAASVAASTVLGACRSGLAEYWDADDGTGLGAIPQSWAGLAIIMDSRSART